MTSDRRQGTGRLVGAVVVLLLAALFAIAGLAESVTGIPGHYEETRGTVVFDDDIIRFEDVVGNEIEFEAFAYAEEGDSFTVFYDPADPAETAFTAEGQSELVLWTFIIAAFLAGVAALLFFWWWRGSKA